MSMQPSQMEVTKEVMMENAPNSTLAFSLHLQTHHRVERGEAPVRVLEKQAEAAGDVS